MTLSWHSSDKGSCSGGERHLKFKTSGWTRSSDDHATVERQSRDGRAIFSWRSICMVVKDSVWNSIWALRLRSVFILAQSSLQKYVNILQDIQNIDECMKHIVKELRGMPNYFLISNIKRLLRGNDCSINSTRKYVYNLYSLPCIYRD